MNLLADQGFPQICADLVSASIIGDYSGDSCFQEIVRIPLLLAQNSNTQLQFYGIVEFC